MLDQLIDQIYMLEEQIPLHPEITQVHTLLFAPNLTMQETIFKQQGLFDTQNKLQKLAVKLKALKAKKTKYKERSGINNIPYDKYKTCGKTHNHQIKKIE